MANRNGVKVLLNGQGADEYMGGYGQFTTARYANMLKQLRIFSLVRDITNLHKIKPVSNLILSKEIALFLLPTSFIRIGRRISSSSDHIKKLININRQNLICTHPYDNIPINYTNVPEISEHLTFYSTLPKYLRWEDRNSMAHSVEARVPFLDHRLVEFTYSLPEDFLEKDGITKRVMREAMKGLLPTEIQTRKDKMGFTTPEEQWVKKDNPDIFRKKISEAISLTNGIIKPEAIKYFDDVVNGKLSFDYTYWRIIMFSEWVQKFKVMT